MSGTRVRTARNADVPALQALVAGAFAPFTARTGIQPAPVADWETVVWALGTNAVRLATNERMTEALASYPRRGYTEVGRETVHGFSRVLFEKRLA